MIRPLRTREEVLAALPGDRLLRQLVGHRADERPAYAYGRAAGVYHLFGGEPELVVVGDPADAAALVRAVVAEHPDVNGGSVPRDAAPLLDGLGWVTYVGWSFRWTDTAPPAPDGVGWLDADDEVRALLAEAFPDASLPVGHPDVRRWAGLRRDGRLVAVAADATLDDELGFLASIASHPDARGTGAGLAVTAWATAALVREHGACGLWHMAGNVPAIAVYDRLGYHDDHPMLGVGTPEDPPPTHDHE